MKWLPALRWKESWWRLPLSRGSCEFIAALWLDNTTAEGPLADREWAISQTTRAFGADPALWIYAVLQHAAEDPRWQSATLDLNTTADWWIDRSMELFGDGDRALVEWEPGNAGPDDMRWNRSKHEDPLDHPLAEPVGDSGFDVGSGEAEPDLWHQLTEHALALPTSEWLGLAKSWLESFGPRVPAEWQGTWPSSVLSGDDLAEAEVGTDFGHDSGQPGHTARRCLPLGDGALDLRRLANRLRRSAILESQFSAQLQLEKMSSLRQLAYGLTHEINNPLANIRTRAEQLAQAESDPVRHQRLQRIVDQAMRAHEMIADLMYFARPPALNWTELDSVALAGQAIAALESECGERAIRLALEASPGATELVLADERQLLDALLALLRNSAEAIGDRGTIAVEVRRHRRRVEWLVCDSGPGLSSEARQHAFDPYYSGREAGRGLGLGLSRVYRVAKSHGGGVSIEGGPIGCCIRLWIPLRPTRFE